MLERFLNGTKLAAKWSSIGLLLVICWNLMLTTDLLADDLAQSSILWLAVSLYILGMPLSIFLGLHESRSELGLDSNELLLLYAAIIAWINISFLWGFFCVLHRTKPKILRREENSREASKAKR